MNVMPRDNGFLPKQRKLRIWRLQVIDVLLASNRGTGGGLLKERLGPIPWIKFRKGLNQQFEREGRVEPGILEVRQGEDAKTGGKSFR